MPQRGVGRRPLGGRITSPANRDVTASAHLDGGRHPPLTRSTVRMPAKLNRRSLNGHDCALYHQCCSRQEQLTADVPVAVVALSDVGPAGRNPRRVFILTLVAKLTLLPV